MLRVSNLRYCPAILLRSFFCRLVNSWLILSLFWGIGLVATVCHSWGWFCILCLMRRWLLFSRVNCISYFIRSYCRGVFARNSRGLWLISTSVRSCERLAHIHISALSGGVCTLVMRVINQPRTIFSRISRIWPFYSQHLDEISCLFHLSRKWPLPTSCWDIW